MRKADWRRFHTTPGLSSRVFHAPLRSPPQIHNNPQKSIVQIARMVSTASAEEQWTASRVRDTFLGYFKQNGHTFGMVDFTCRKDFDEADGFFQCPHLRLCLIQIPPYSLPMLA